MMKVVKSSMFQKGLFDDSYIDIILKNTLKQINYSWHKIYTSLSCFWYSFALLTNTYIFTNILCIVIFILFLFFLIITYLRAKLEFRFKSTILVRTKR